MKKFGAILLLSSLILSCKKDDPEPVNEIIETSGKTLTYQGTLSTGTKSTSGSIKIFETANSQELVFENLATGNGPDVRVYLSKNEKTISESVLVGSLKSTSGSFSYVLPSSADVTAFPNVVIWCDDFPQAFGFGKLNIVSIP